MRSIKAIFLSCMRVFLQLKLSVKIAIVVIVMAFVIAGAIEATSQTGFCNFCHIMNPYYASWKESKHSEVNCLSCHLQPGFAGFIKGKINGLAQAVDCMVGRVGTKPNAAVKDASCLRSECHSTKELLSKNITYNTIDFTHKNHIEKVVDGIEISCGTCHSHFEGDEHFSVNRDVCFTCHFLKSETSGERLVQTTCQSCHEVPDKQIERGFVAVNHSEFVSYEASCEDSCHKKEIEKYSVVSESACLSCHSFSKGEHTDSVELHLAHTGGEKVECFACHGKVLHGQTEVSSVSAMMDCESCHSDTHNIQFSAYTASQHPQDKDTGRILSPMFLTHVECTGCHIEQKPVSSEGLGSIGMVAKAVPRACDKCHEPGTGQRYVPFWQGKIKKLHEQVSGKLFGFESISILELDQKKVKERQDKIKQVRTILDSVKADGSWGVHNLKYTEAMLLKANQIITESQ